MLGIMGTKQSMLQLFQENGEAIPVTAILTGNCQVVQVKTEETDAYNALQLGFQEKKESRINKAEAGHFKRNGLKPKQFLREFRVNAEEVKKYKNGDNINTEIFKVGEYVDVEGRSKGRGFAGVMKRHNFGGAPASHGTHEYFRHGGSIGCSATPGRVAKGKKMPGHMGDARVTLQNLEIVKIVPEDNLIFVKGAIPGAKNGLVMVKKAKKKTAVNN